MGSADGKRTERQRVDVVMYPSGEVKAVPAGKGGEIVRSYRERDAAPGIAARVLTWLVVVVVLAYSLLIVRNFLLGLLAAALVYVAARVVPRLTGSDAALLDAGLSLQDAREQWDATPVSAVEVDTRRGRRDHATEATETIR